MRMPIPPTSARELQLYYVVKRKAVNLSCILGPGGGKWTYLSQSRLVHVLFLRVIFTYASYLSSLHLTGHWLLGWWWRRRR